MTFRRRCRTVDLSGPLCCVRTVDDSPGSLPMRAHFVRRFLPRATAVAVAAAVAVSAVAGTPPTATGTERATPQGDWAGLWLSTSQTGSAGTTLSHVRSVIG